MVTDIQIKSCTTTFLGHITDIQKETISKLLKKFLKARALYPNSSQLTYMMKLLSRTSRAHRANDKAVMEAYGLTKVKATE